MASDLVQEEIPQEGNSVMYYVTEPTDQAGGYDLVEASNIHPSDSHFSGEGHVLVFASQDCLYTTTDAQIPLDSSRRAKVPTHYGLKDNPTIDNEAIQEMFSYVGTDDKSGHSSEVTMPEDRLKVDEEEPTQEIFSEVRAKVTFESLGRMSTVKRRSFMSWLKKELGDKLAITEDFENEAVSLCGSLKWINLAESAIKSRLCQKREVSTNNQSNSSTRQQKIARETKNMKRTSSSGGRRRSTRRCKLENRVSDDDDVDDNNEKIDEESERSSFEVGGHVLREKCHSRRCRAKEESDASFRHDGFGNQLSADNNHGGEYLLNGTEGSDDALLECVSVVDVSGEDPQAVLASLGKKQSKKKDYESLTPYKFFCDDCSFRTKRRSHFTKHRRLHDSAATVLTCQHCDFKTLKRCHLQHHVALVHRGRRPRRQGRGGKMAALGEEVPSEVYQCQVCSYRSASKPRMLRHIRIHSQKILLHKSTEGENNVGVSEGRSEPSGAELLSCDECEYKTVRKEHLKRHRRDVHGNTRPWLCPTCGRSFKRSDALQQHAQTHNAEQKSTVLRHTCPTCNKSFRSRAHLTEHQAVHSDDRRFLCDTCGATFKTRSCQRKHVDNIHRAPRSHVCLVCEKRFNTLYSLQRHQMTHTGERQDEKVTTRYVTPEYCISTSMRLTEHQNVEQIELKPMDAVQMYIVP